MDVTKAITDSRAKLDDQIAHYAKRTDADLLEDLHTLMIERSRLMALTEAIATMLDTRLGREKFEATLDAFDQAILAFQEKK